MRDCVGSGSGSGIGIGIGWGYIVIDVVIVICAVFSVHCVPILRFFWLLLSISKHTMDECMNYIT